jgi:hypothetical protein
VQLRRESASRRASLEDAMVVKRRRRYPSGGVVRSVQWNLITTDTPPISHAANSVGGGHVHHGCLKTNAAANDPMRNNQQLHHSTHHPVSTVTTNTPDKHVIIPDNSPPSENIDNTLLNSIRRQTIV